MPLKQLFQLFKIFLCILLAIPEYWRKVSLLPATSKPIAQALWLHQLCQRTLKACHVKIESRGSLPKGGVLVSNHMTYLDILVLCSLTPCVFVSKKEVARWPVFGSLARMAGTLFLNRSQRGDVARVGEEMQGLVRDGAMVVFFPEGTTSNGEDILPFKTSLFEVVLAAKSPLTVVALQYHLEKGEAKAEAAWTNTSFFRHFWSLLKHDVKVCAVWGESFAPGTEDRKILAVQAREVMCTLRQKAVFN